MSIPIAPGDVVVFCGDSITDRGAFVPAVAAINRLLTPRRSGAPSRVLGRSVASGARRGACASIPQQPIIAIMSGTPGDTAANIAANVPGRITNYNPDAVFLFVGVNDCLTATPLATFNANVDTILAGIAAYNPNVPTAVLSIFEIGEQWAAGPVFDNHFDPPPGNPGFTPSIAQYNTETQTALADSTLTDEEYIDLRAPALAFEVANNPGPPGAANGVLTIDGFHPNGRGNNFISAVVVANVAVS